MICHTLKEIRENHHSGDFVWKPGYSVTDDYSGIDNEPVYGKLLFDESNPNSTIIFQEDHLFYNPHTGKDEIRPKKQILKDYPYFSIADTFPEVKLLYLNRIQNQIRQLTNKLDYYVNLSFQIQNYNKFDYRLTDKGKSENA